MSQTDWAKTYAEMDKRIILKYQQLPEASRSARHRKQGKNQKEANRIAGAIF